MGHPKYRGEKSPIGNRSLIERSVQLTDRCLLDSSHHESLVDT